MSLLFDSFYAAAACNPAFDDPSTTDVVECYAGGIYTRETFDAIAIIGLAQAIALQTPADDGVKEMLGLTVAGPDAPQLGASGVHIFDSHGDVGGSGYDVCTFGLDSDGAATFTCHSTWGLIDGLDDQGIPKAPPVAVPGCMDSTANNYNADATVDGPGDDKGCTFDAVEPEPEPKEETDEVPGFGLLSAIAAIGVALVLRRRF